MQLVFLGNFNQPVHQYTSHGGGNVILTLHVPRFWTIFQLQDVTGFIQVRLCKIQGLFKNFLDFPTVFKD